MKNGGRWIVFNGDRIVDREFYAADTLGDALALGRMYKALAELNTGRVHNRVNVVKCGGTPLQHHIDGTQTHYV